MWLYPILFFTYNADGHLNSTRVAIVKCYCSTEEICVHRINFVNVDNEGSPGQIHREQNRQLLIKLGILTFVMKELLKMQEFNILTLTWE